VVPRAVGPDALDPQAGPRRRQSQKYQPNVKNSWRRPCSRPARWPSVPPWAVCRGGVQRSIAIRRRK